MSRGFSGPLIINLRIIGKPPIEICTFYTRNSNGHWISLEYLKPIMCSTVSKSF